MRSAATEMWLRMHLISLVDKVVGTASTNMVCLLRSRLKEVLNFNQSLVRIKLEMFSRSGVGTHSSVHRLQVKNLSAPKVFPSTVWLYLGGGEG